MTTKRQRELREHLASGALLAAICSPGPVQDAWLAAAREYPAGPSFPERLQALAAEREAPAGR